MSLQHSTKRAGNEIPGDVVNTEHIVAFSIVIYPLLIGVLVNYRSQDRYFLWGINTAWWTGCSLLYCAHLYCVQWERCSYWDYTVLGRRQYIFHGWRTSVIVQSIYLQIHATLSISMVNCVWKMWALFVANNWQRVHNSVGSCFSMYKSNVLLVPRGGSTPCTGSITTDRTFVLLYLISFLTHLPLGRISFTRNIVYITHTHSANDKIQDVGAMYGLCMIICDCLLVSCRSL